MTISPRQGVVQHLRRAVLTHNASRLTDGQLLTLFIEQRDETAFEALVRRHGPMVMGVCRRILRNPHDAEDAFQAAFLVLVRKAASVVPREMVANWLYGVARMTAHRGNALTAKRRKRETQVSEMPEPAAVTPDVWNDLRPLLDQELGGLPDKYRVAIFLCDLEGKSHKEAARQLGWPQGTLSGRLVRARKLLARRLAKHGLATSGGVLAESLSRNGASASVPISLVSNTVKAASLVAAGQKAVAGLISVKAAALTEGVVLTMLVNKLKAITMMLIIAAIVGGAGLAYRTQAAEPVQEAAGATDAQVGREVEPLEREAKSEWLEHGGRGLLSSNPMPQQAMVSMEKGRILVRTLDFLYTPTTVSFEGQPRTSYRKDEIMRTQRYDNEIVKVYDVKGKSVHKKELSRLLKKERLALISRDSSAVDPLNLRLFKEDTLLFVLPAELPPAVSPPRPPERWGGPAPTMQIIRPAPAMPVIFPAPPVNPPASPVLGGQSVWEVHAREMKIPVGGDPERRADVKSLRLMASVNEGKTWSEAATISPDQDCFVFKAPKDGLYWLTLQIIGRDNTAKPSDLTVPGLGHLTVRVIYATTK